MNVALVPEETSTTIDLLNRQEFVNQLLQVAGVLSQNRKNACYAVNGTWGTGKSFVMDMFEKQAQNIGQEGSTLSRYLVFHYNCWEFDYYEEPLLAIVITMLDAIDRSVNLIDAKTKTKIKEVLKIVAKGLGKKAVATIEEKTGVEVQKAIDVVSDGLQNAEIESQNDFDPYCDFKLALHQLRDEVTSLSKEQTVIFAVDELDRCLPEYAIRVLERLHHLFNGISNVQVILSIDKKQLKHTVQQIYGPETDVNKYLAKFINFELDLPTGSFEDQRKLETTFEDYFQMFEYQFAETNQSDIIEFCRIVFEKIDIRSRISVIDKCILLHNILHQETIKEDYSIMTIEIILSLLHFLEVDCSSITSGFIGSKVRFCVRSSNGFDRPVIEKLSQKYDERKYYRFSKDDEGDICLIYGNSIWGVVLAAYFTILEGGKFFLSGDTRYGKIPYDEQKISAYAKEFWTLLQIVR